MNPNGEYTQSSRIPEEVTHHMIGDAKGKSVEKKTRARIAARSLLERKAAAWDRVVEAADDNPNLLTRRVLSIIEDLRRELEEGRP